MDGRDMARVVAPAQRGRKPRKGIEQLRRSTHPEAGSAEDILKVARDPELREEELRRGTIRPEDVPQTFPR